MIKDNNRPEKLVQDLRYSKQHRYANRVSNNKYG